MGFYIEVENNLDKAGQLVRNYGAEILPAPPASVDELTPGKVLVCVVENGLFDAAAVCYDDRELRDFQYEGDDRPKKWLLVDREVVLTLCHAADFGDLSERLPAAA